MAVSKEKKEEILNELKENFKKAKFAAFVNFHGLSVSAASELRKLLGGLNTKYLVAKKTLINKAMSELGFEGEAPALEGEIAMAFSEDDPVASARALKDFARKNSIKLAGGIFENKFIGKETVVMLANIPPREVLLGQFVNVINSPVKGFAGALNGIIRNFASVLSEIGKKK